MPKPKVPALPKPPKPKKPKKRSDLLARSLAARVRDTYGEGQAATLDCSEELGAPRGWIGTRNIALERALGAPGIPMGRITEISGWEGAGKSTVADQIIAEAQSRGGIGVLADTERARDRRYMANLGALPESTIWLGGRTVESLFAEGELLVRDFASRNALAWHRALKEAGINPPKLTTYTFTLTAPGSGPKPKVLGRHKLYEWDAGQAAALSKWQKREGLPQSALRDSLSRQSLQPVIVHTEATDAKAMASEVKAHMSDWKSGRDTPYVQLADRPVVWVWDSVAGTPTREELQGQAEDMHVASAAKAIRRNLRRVVQLIDDEAVALVLVNQRYEVINTGFSRGRGPKSETYGGGGVRYHSSVRVELTRVANIKTPGSTTDWAPPMGQVVKVRVPKSKVSDPYRQEEFGLIFGRGADNAWALYDDFKKRGIIAVAGSWSRFSDPSILGDDNKAFQGWTGLSNLLAQDETLYDRLRDLYRGPA